MTTDLRPDSPVLLCRCGESGPTEPAGIWSREHMGDGHLVTVDRNRADCSPPSGCRRCGKQPGGRFTFYCGAECREWFENNHWWTAARFTALGYIRSGDGYWRPTVPTLCAHADDTCSPGGLEVDHMGPLNGVRPDWGCVHHQETLQPFCHSHHVRETKAQRRDGRIGTEETARALRAKDDEVRIRQAQRDFATASNPRLL